MKGREAVPGFGEAFGVASTGSLIRNRRGRTLVELVVALPLLALATAAVAGLLMTGGGLLLESERRLEVASRGPALLDSLRALPGDAPESGVLTVMGIEAPWEWDGQGRLTLVLPAGPRGTTSEVEWVLEARPVGGSDAADGGPDAGDEA